MVCTHVQTRTLLQVEAEEALGSGVRRTDLVPGGSSIPVTAANRQQYAELYARHLLDTSISWQFGAFERGFKRVRLPLSSICFPQNLGEMLVAGQARCA